MKAALALVMLLTLACGSATPGPVGSPLSVPQLQFRVLDAVGKPAWCDPDFYPLGHPEMPNAIAQYPAIKADTATYAAIVEHEHLPSGSLTDEQKLTVYRAWKLLRPVSLARDGDHYTFDYTVAGQTSYERVSGTVAIDGTVSVRSRAPGQRPNCPICLAASTMIATPGGRELYASPGHRTADGRPLGALKTGDPLDGSTVALWELVPYAGSRTYDLLPAGPTGYYWADWIPLASTL